MFIDYSLTHRSFALLASRTFTTNMSGLEKLNLGANLIGDAGVYELSYALLLQRSLKELSLYANMYALGVDTYI
jgi:hypothetical protein